MTFEDVNDAEGERTRAFREIITIANEAQRLMDLHDDFMMGDGSATSALSSEAIQGLDRAFVFACRQLLVLLGII
jgi:hypothetical protein